MCFMPGWTQGFGIPSVAGQKFVVGYKDHPQHFKQLDNNLNKPITYFRPTALDALGTSCLVEWGMTPQGWDSL